MSGLREAVTKFLAERDGFIRALENCPSDSKTDYWRWQGHAEARRTFREALEREGIDLTIEPAPVASRERVAEAIEQGASSVDLAKYFLPGATDAFVHALLAAGVFRDEATVKAEVGERIARKSQELIGGGPGDIAAAIAREEAER